VTFAPRPCDLDFFRGVVPTERGFIAASCRTVDGIREFTLAVPEDMEVQTELPENSRLTVIRYASR